MAKDTPLKITYRQTLAKTKPAAFFAEINDRIAQVKSLSAYVQHSCRFPEILKTTPAPRLETLRFLTSWPDTPDTNDTLFGGQRASPALKNLYVNYIPVALESLHLSGLRSLWLSDIPITSPEGLLSILMGSPALKTCSFQELDFLTGFTPSGHLQTLLRSQSSIEGRAIRLLQLRHLAFSGDPVSFLQLLLSNIQVSTFQSFDIRCRLRESPASELLTTDTLHLAPALKFCTGTADKIEINTIRDMGLRICVGMLLIDLHALSAKPRRVEEVLTWVFGRRNEHFKTLPTGLAIQEFDQYEDLIIWLSLNLKVTKLANWISFWSLQRREQCNIVSLLSRPVESMSNQWALPDLEFIDLKVLDEAAKSEVLEMVEARHSFTQTQEDQGQGDVALKQFKEIRLHREIPSASQEQAVDAEFLGALEKIGRGAEIWWEGVKWAGDRTEAELVV
ncbi:hypothetical protein FRC01_006657 [Tulasnella sp. 417]|nr:hypothetical protein FRC01_006657 [Tulasnella sp. 417]